MSAKIKNAGRIGTKVVAAFLFLFLLMVNVEVGLYDGGPTEGGILGLTMSVFVPGALADGEVNVFCESPLTNHRCQWSRILEGAYCFSGHEGNVCRMTNITIPADNTW